MQSGIFPIVLAIFNLNILQVWNKRIQETLPGVHKEAACCHEIENAIELGVL